MDNFIIGHQFYIMYILYFILIFSVFNLFDGHFHKKVEFGLNLFIALFLAIVWMAILQKNYIFGIGLWIFITCYAKIIYKALFIKKPSSKKDDQVLNS